MISETQMSEILDMLFLEKTVIFKTERAVPDAIPQEYLWIVELTDEKIKVTSVCEPELVNICEHGYEQGHADLRAMADFIVSFFNKDDVFKNYVDKG